MRPEQEPKANLQSFTRHDAQLLGNTTLGVIQAHGRDLACDVYTAEKELVFRAHGGGPEGATDATNGHIMTCKIKVAEKCAGQNVLSHPKTALKFALTRASYLRVDSA